jgi:hypothetical protein
MKATLAAALAAIGLLTTPSHSQDVPGSQGVTAPGGEVAGPQESSKRKGRRGTEQKTAAPAPKADDKAYRSALDRMSNQKYDPWHDLR